MIQVQRHQLHAEIPRGLTQVLLSELKPDFTPLITSVKREYWSKLGISPPETFPSPLNPTASGGELYLSKNGNLLYFKVGPHRDFLECGALTKNDDVAEFNDFFESVKPLVERELKTKQLSWETLGVDEALLELTSKRATMKPTKEEISIANELEDENLLKTFVEAQKRRPHSDGSSPSAEGQPLDPESLNKLVSLGLMTKEFVVLCKERGQQIIKVNSREAIEETSQKGLKCFLCGKPISDESVEELLSPTELGRQMIEKGFWLPIRVLNALLNVGFKTQEIVLDTDDGVSTMYFVVGGELLLIAIFDKKPSLSNWYTLSAKLSVNNARMGIVVHAHPISSVHKELLLQSNPGREFHFVESLTGLEGNMGEILQQHQEETVRKLIQPFSDLTPVSLRDLICQKIFLETEEPRKSGKRGKSSEEKAKV